MKYHSWMNFSKIVLTLYLLMPLYAITQTDSTTKYQNFSKEQLQTFELQKVARILPQAESYYEQNKIKTQIIKEQTKVIDTLDTALNKAEEIMKLYEKQLQLKDKEIEIVKPKWWQHPLVIVAEVILSLITGVLIAK